MDNFLADPIEIENVPLFGRGCGFRKAGGIYIESHLYDKGAPIEDFLIDYPIQVDDSVLSKLGVKLENVDGVYNIIDGVGSDNYPNVADFIEEARYFGISRKLSPLLDFSKITEESLILFWHKRAIFDVSDENTETILSTLYATADPTDGLDRCPCKKDGHYEIGETNTCAGIWWQTVEGGIPIANMERMVVRKMPSFEYLAKEIKTDKIKYLPGIFMWAKVGNIAVIKDPVAGSHEDALEKVKNAGIEVRLVDR